jgi:hypothetical protein
MAAKFLTHHIPDEGVQFIPGDVVSLIHAAGRVQIIKDSAGEYVVTGGRTATEYTDSSLVVGQCAMQPTVPSGRVRLAFFSNAPVFFEGDARGYLVRAVEIVTGDGLNFTLKRTPGYSLLIAAVFAVAGPSLGAVVVVQHLLGVGTAALTYGCARSIAGRPAGLIAGLATAASGSSLIYEHAILTEALFGCILVGGTWRVVVGLKRQSPAVLALAGVVAGIGAVVRPVGLTLALVGPLLMVGSHPSRRGLVTGGAYLAAFGLIVMPWIVRNGLVHGEATPVHPGRFLIERTIKSNQTGVSMYAAPAGPDQPRLLREGRKILRGIESEQPTSFEVHATLARRLELTDVEASDLMWDLAVDAIRREPGAYLSGTWIELVQLIAGHEESVREHVLTRRSAWKGEDLEQMLDDGAVPDLLPEVWPEQGRRLPVAEALAHLYQPSRWIDVLLLASLLAAIWVLRDPSKRAVLIPLVIAAALVCCTVTINGAYARYRYPLDPLLHIAAAAGLVWSASLLLRSQWTASWRPRVSSFSPAAKA